MHIDYLAQYKIYNTCALKGYSIKSVTAHKCETTHPVLALFGLDCTLLSITTQHGPEYYKGTTVIIVLSAIITTITSTAPHLSG